MKFAIRKSKKRQKLLIKKNDHREVARKIEEYYRSACVDKWKEVN